MDLGTEIQQPTALWQWAAIFGTLGGILIPLIYKRLCSRPYIKLRFLSHQYNSKVYLTCEIRNEPLDSHFLRNWVDRKPEEIQASFTINDGWTNKPIIENVVPDICDFRGNGSKQRIDLPASKNSVYFIVAYFDGIFHVPGHLNPVKVELQGIHRVRVSISGLKRNYYKEASFWFDGKANCWKFVSEDSGLRKRYKDRLTLKRQKKG